MVGLVGESFEVSKSSFQVQGPSLPDACISGCRLLATTLAPRPPACHHDDNGETELQTGPN